MRRELMSETTTGIDDTDMASGLASLDEVYGSVTRDEFVYMEGIIARAREGQMGWLGIASSGRSSNWSAGSGQS
jgi:hypothetical protein